jgi:hypothetical protein
LFLWWCFWSSLCFTSENRRRYHLTLWTVLNFCHFFQRIKFQINKIDD